MKIETDLMSAVCRATDAMQCWLKHRQHYLPLIEDERMKDVYCSWASDKIYIGASGSAEQLTVLFRALAFHEFHLDKRAKRPAENEPEWAGMFTKQWTDCEGSNHFLYVYVNFTSTVCQRKQVGTEMKEVPIYKIVCGDVISDEPVSISDEIPF